MEYLKIQLKLETEKSEVWKMLEQPASVDTSEIYY